MVSIACAADSNSARVVASLDARDWRACCMVRASRSMTIVARRTSAKITAVPATIDADVCLPRQTPGQPVRREQGRGGNTCPGAGEQVHRPCGNVVFVTARSFEAGETSHCSQSPFYTDSSRCFCQTADNSGTGAILDFDRAQADIEEAPVLIIGLIKHLIPDQNRLTRRQYRFETAMQDLPESRPG